MITDSSTAELSGEPKKVPLVIYFGRERIVLGEATLNPDGTFEAKVNAPADERASKVLEAVPGEFRFSLPKASFAFTGEDPELLEVPSHNSLPPLVSNPFPRERYFEPDVPATPRITKYIKIDHISVNDEPSAFEKADPPHSLPVTDE